MPRRLPRALPVALLAILLAGAPGARAEGGLAVTPTDLDFGPVLRDEPVHRTVTAYNSRSTDATIRFEPFGELGAWLTPDPNSFTIPAHSSRSFALVLRAPADAPNGHYAGGVTVIMEPAEADVREGGSVRFALGVRVQAQAIVGGEEVVHVLADGLQVVDVEEKQRVPITLRILNQGNVREAPEVLVQILSSDKRVLHQENVTLAPVAPGVEEIRTLHVTPLLNAGQHWLRLTVVVRGEAIYESTAEFDVLREGDLRRKGEMGSIGAVGLATKEQLLRLKTDQAFRVEVPFKNTGEIDVRAQFRGYIALEGRLVRTLESDTLLLSPGEEVDFRILVDGLRDAGRHIVTGAVYYDDKVTPENEAILTLETPPPARSVPLPGLLVFAAVAVACGLLGRRR